MHQVARKLVGATAENACPGEQSFVAELADRPCTTFDRRCRRAYRRRRAAVTGIVSGLIFGRHRTRGEQHTCGKSNPSHPSFPDGRRDARCRLRRPMPRCMAAPQRPAPPDRRPRRRRSSLPRNDERQQALPGAVAPPQSRRRFGTPQPFDVGAAGRRRTMDAERAATSAVASSASTAVALAIAVGRAVTLPCSESACGNSSTRTPQPAPGGADSGVGNPCGR